MKIKFKDSVKNSVYEHRALKRLSQQQLADSVGVSKQTIFMMEKGDYSPSLVLAYRLSSYLEVSVEELFKYEKGI